MYLLTITTKSGPTVYTLLLHMFVVVIDFGVVLLVVGVLLFLDVV